MEFVCEFQLEKDLQKTQNPMDNFLTEGMLLSLHRNIETFSYYGIGK